MVTICCYSMMNPHPYLPPPSPSPGVHRMDVGPVLHKTDRDENVPPPTPHRALPAVLCVSPESSAAPPPTLQAHKHLSRLIIAVFAPDRNNNRAQTCGA